MKPNYILAIFIALQTINLTGLFSQSTDKNYILTRTMLNEDGSSYLDAIQYYDGLGRPTQLVQKGITPNGSDLVTLQEYDSAGRACRQWIPSPFSNNGNYVENFASESPSKHDGDHYPYTEIQYDNSPLNRVLKETGAGALWHTRGKGVSTRYLTNTLSGTLRVTNYSVDPSGTLSDKGSYAAGELYCAETTDENGNVAYAFTDKLGQTVLTRQMNGTEPHDTYYVYDDFGNLSYVLPPMIDGNISVDNLNKYAYRYQYDCRNRCTEIKLPGCEPVYQIYDKSDRLVLKQDGNQRSRGVWLVNKYDMLGRLLYTSEIKGEDRSFEKLKTDFSKALIVESFTTGNQPYPMEDTGYSRGFYHIAPTTLLTVNYYDDYGFMGLLPMGTRNSLDYYPQRGYDVKYDNAKGLLTGTRAYLLDGSFSYIATAYYYDAHGNVIQKHSTNHIGGHDRHYYKYSFTGKLLKHWHDNANAQVNYAPEIYTYSYDSAERLLGTTHSVFGTIDYTDYSYDEFSRMTQRSFNTGKETENYTYNIRNWLTSIDGSDFREEIIYNSSNNFNGNISMIKWLTPIDNVTRSYSFTYDGLNRLKLADYGHETSQFGVMSKYFNVEVGKYDKNGNILSLSRKGRLTPPVIRSRIINGDDTPVSSSYGMIDDLSFGYDGNQLMSVTDASPNDPVYKDAMHFIDNSDRSTEYTYDNNGNMNSDLNKKIIGIAYNLLNLPEELLQQPDNGRLIPLYPSYNFATHLYDASGNKLQTCYGTEKWKTSSFTGGGLSTFNNIGAVTLPQQPLPAFTKVRTISSKTDYCENYIYENDTLSRILTSEGYIAYDGKRWIHYFYHRDHQGTNRVVISNGDGLVKQVNHYYPFGGLFGESTNGELQRYKYNGKELDRMYGLDLYDYGARWMDPVLGRFTTMDPLCEKYYSISPYAYCNNNPVKYVDPNGMFISPYYNRDGKYLGTDENGFAGDIFITDEETFNENSTNKIANSKLMLNSGKTELLAETTLSNKAYSSIYTHVLNQMEDMDFSYLYNGKVSVREDNKIKKENGVYKAIGYNNPSYSQNQARFSTDILNDQIRISVSNRTSELSNVESIWNYLGIHEYYGHGIKKWGDSSNNHWKCYDAQIRHHTFNKLSNELKNDIKRLNFLYKRRK